MQRRSNSKSAAKEQYPERTQRSTSKRHRATESNNDRQTKYNQVQKRIKQNLMYSLIEVFQQSRNEPSLIVPWMKIIGTNYMIVGPSQSGKYSAVKFALGEYYPDVQEILINCQISTTEYQFIHKLLHQFSRKAPKCKWPLQEKEINKLISNDNIDFSKLNPFIEKGNLKFVIIIRNGQHLVGFKKQTMLYNLFEWVRSEFIQERGGLVILTRNLMLIDRFQKRVRSRFQGNRLTIFRPVQAQIYIKIITKRIQAVIKDKQIWFQEQKLQQAIPMQVQNDFYDSEEETNTRKRPQPIRGNKSKKVDVQEFYSMKQKYTYVKQLIDYSHILTQYLDKGYQEIGISDFFQNKITQFYQSKHKQEMRLYSDQSIFTVQEQIDCLKKIKKAIEKSKKISFYFKTKILQNQVISIPFVLRIFQHIFLTIEENIVKQLPLEKLEMLILKLFQKNVEFEFPVNVIESNLLESLNNIEMLLLIIIYEMIQNRVYPIRLTKIHNEYKSVLHKTIHTSTHNSSDKLPTKFIQQAINRLYRNGIISYQPHNVWNCQISVCIQIKKIQKGFEQLLKTCSDKLNSHIKGELKRIFYSHKDQTNENKQPTMTLQ